jgi:hypothetical protein
MALLVLMMGRGAAWAVAALPAGLGQGIALREPKVVLNGLLGGVLGGLLGGVVFDPIGLAIPATNGEAWLSRGVGFTIIGLMVGLFVGVVEQWTKSAWLLMKAGPLAGKQFVIFRNPTVLGSSPKAEVYLFKDEAIEPRHALSAPSAVRNSRRPTVPWGSRRSARDAEPWSPAPSRSTTRSWWRPPREPPAAWTPMPTSIRVSLMPWSSRNRSRPRLQRVAARARCAVR